MNSEGSLRHTSTMPELPEVEAARRFMEKTAVGSVIDRVISVEQGGGPRDGEFDDKVIEGETAVSFCDKLEGRRLVSAQRKGKQLWLELDNACGLFIHNGMTGALLVRGEATPRYKNTKFNEDEWPPRFAKFELVLKGGTRVAFSDARRFGRVSIQANPTRALAELASDPLRQCPSIDEWVACLGRRSCAVKGVLLDQRAIVSGVGNWVADEVLYAAGVHPAAPAKELAAAQVIAIRDALMQVVKVACDVNADSDEFPPTWLFHHRWKGQTSGSADSPLGRIHFEKVAGRTTAYIPSRQKKVVLATSRSPHFRNEDGPSSDADPQPPVKKRRRRTTKKGRDPPAPKVESS